MTPYLTQGLHRAVQQFPQRTATVFGERRHAFHALADRVARLARILRAQGLQQGDRVAVLAQNSDRYVEAFLAVWWAGAAVNPVNTRWSVPEIVFSLQDCQSSLLLVDEVYASQAAAVAVQVPCLRAVLYIGDGEAPAGMLPAEVLIGRSEPLPDAVRQGNDLAAILYTGGTTGFPKGVMLSHANLWSAAVARLAELPNAAQSISLLTTPLFHVAGLGRLVSQIVIGATSVIEPVFRPDTVLEALERHGVNDVVLVPSMLPRGCAACSASCMALHPCPWPCCSGPWRPCRRSASSAPTA